MDQQRRQDDQPMPGMDLIGHPALRATHTKTIEFSADRDVTERATCVVGVGSRVTGAACAGPVEITISAGHGADHGTTTVTAVANPDWAGGTAIVRVGTDRGRQTFATEASAAAADLPRDLVARLTDPDAAVTVRCRRLPRRPDGRGALILLWMPAGSPSTPRLVAESAAADLVVAEDAGAREVVARAHTPGARAAAALLDGSAARVLVLATAGLPGSSVSAALAQPALVAVEVAGLPPAVAVAAGSPHRGPVHLAGPAGRGDGVLRSVPAAVTLVVSVAARELRPFLDRAAAVRGTTTAAVLDPAAGGPVVWGPVADLRPRRSGGELVCALDGGGTDLELGTELTAFVRGLLAGGVSPRSVALAVAGLPGWSRRRAYDAVLAVDPER